VPTVSEPVDLEQRQGKALSLLQYYHAGALGPATTEASLRILRYEVEEIRALMEKHAPPEHRRM
jgi:hypothetical protein